MNFYMKLNELGFGTYEEYLDSKHWKSLRKRMKKKLKYRCKCGVWEPLQLHHKSYKRLGDEHISHLIWLCGPCHRKTHEIQKTGINLWLADSEMRKTEWFKKRKLLHMNDPQPQNRMQQKRSQPKKNPLNRKQSRRFNLETFTQDEMLEILGALGLLKENKVRKRVCDKIHKWIAQTDAPTEDIFTKLFHDLEILPTASQSR